MHCLYTKKYKWEKHVVKCHQMMNSISRLGSPNWIPVEHASSSEMNLLLYRMMVRKNALFNGGMRSTIVLLSSSMPTFQIRLDTESVKTSNDMCTVTFYFQQNLPLPRTPPCFTCTCTSSGCMFLAYIAVVTTTSPCIAGLKCWLNKAVMRLSRAYNISCLNCLQVSPLFGCFGWM